MKTKLDLALEKLKENTCLSCGRIRLHIGCCKLGCFHDIIMTLTIAQLVTPLALENLNKSKLL